MGEQLLIIGIILKIICLMGFAVLIFSMVGYTKFVDFLIDFPDEFKSLLKISRKQSVDKKDILSSLLMNDKETKQKYLGIEFDKVVIVPSPLFLFDISNKKIVDYDKVLMDDNIKCIMCFIYDELDLETINKSEKIFIYPHDSDKFRYTLIENKQFKQEKYGK